MTAATNGSTSSRGRPPKQPQHPAPADADGAANDDSKKGAGYTGLSPSDIIARWETEGPLERLATGWPTFDEATRGGFVLGRLGFLLGAPNAMKTAMLACLARRWAREDVAIAALMVDEDPSDFVTRLAVQAGIPLDAAEKRAPAVLARIELALGKLPIRLYGPASTIESAAGDFDRWMKSKRLKRGVFLADSLQTISCDAARDEHSLRVAVGANVKALASVASRYRFATIATGEIPRASYESGRNTDDMRAGKESGAIEYAAKIQLVLRRVKRSDDLVQVRAPKIKRGTKDETEFFLRFDRVSHALVEDPGGGVALRGATEAAIVAVRKSILEHLARAAREGRQLSTLTKIADAVGGRRATAMSTAKAMSESGEIRLVDGSFRPAEEARR